MCHVFSFAYLKVYGLVKDYPIGIKIRDYSPDYLMPIGTLLTTKGAHLKFLFTRDHTLSDGSDVCSLGSLGGSATGVLGHHDLCKRLTAG